MARKYLWIEGLACCLSACSFNKNAPLEERRSIATWPDHYESIKVLPYQEWAAQPLHEAQRRSYQAFLRQHQVFHVLPESELFHTARDWKLCHTRAFEVPPSHLWNNIVPTLKILKILVHHQVIQSFTVTPVYRNADLNRCAGGADSSKHVLNAALDLRLGAPHLCSSERNRIQHSKDKLCAFWRKCGRALSMGLGVYRSALIHIDSAGYRTWGFNHQSKSSPCLIQQHRLHNYKGKVNEHIKT